MAAQIFSSIWILLAGAIVLVLPGIAWQAWFSPRQAAGAPPPDPARRLADAAGLSIALTALAALGTFLLGLRLAGWMVIALYALLALLAAAGLVRRRRPGRLSLAAALPLLVTLSLVFIVVAWRLSQAASLVLPAWVDSVHHVLIVRVFLEQGALPASLDPYIPVPFYYHYGFHALAALFAFLTRLPPEQAVLILGQVINAAICLAVYRLGRAFWPDWLRPLGAALLVAFFAHMPAYYLTWGRYTLLTGLLLLPVAMAQVVDLNHASSGAARAAPERKEAVARLAVLTGGLLVTHYLAAVLLALFLGVMASGQVLGALRRRAQPGLDTGGVDGGRSGDSHPAGVLAAWLAGAGLGLLAALPWLWRIWTHSRPDFQVGLVLDSPDQVYFPDYLNYLWYLSGPRRNYLLLALGGLGGLLALIPSAWWAFRPRIARIWPAGRVQAWFRRPNRTGGVAHASAPPDAQPATGSSTGQAEPDSSPTPPGVPQATPHPLPAATALTASASVAAASAAPDVETAPSAGPYAAPHAAPPTASPAAPPIHTASPGAGDLSPSLGALLAWMLLVVVLTVPYGVRLGPFRPDHMAIVWFLPFSLFASHLLVSACQVLWRLGRGELGRGERGRGERGRGERNIPDGDPDESSPALRARLPILGLAGTVLVWGLLLVWGVRDTFSILNTGTVLADQADRAALSWIEANTPPEARFWINVTGWQGSIYRGVDGGWWIQPLTRRATALPAVLYSTGPRDYFTRITRWAEQASQIKECSAEFHESLRSSGATHVYLHAGKGSLQPAALAGCKGLDRVYEGEGVVIFRVAPAQGP